MTRNERTELFLCIILVLLAIGFCVYQLGSCARQERRNTPNRHIVDVSRRSIEMGVLLRAGVIPLVIRENSEEEDMCAVCLSELEEGDVLRMLVCGHVFHGECVDPWVIGQQTCPLCKADVLATLPSINPPLSITSESVV